MSPHFNNSLGRGDVGDLSSTVFLCFVRSVEEGCRFIKISGRGSIMRIGGL